MNVELHIERLVLDGLSFTAIERAQLRAALEVQLAERLGRDPGLLLAGEGAVPRLSAPGVRLDSTSPTTVADRVAESVATTLAPARAGDVG